MMNHARFTSRYGARPLGFHRGGRVPGPQPQGGPPSATGGNLTSSCSARGRGVRESATGPETTSIGKHVNIIHWNAEGVFNKKLPLAERLKKENIDVACLQETHLKDTHRFSIRGYQVFRLDREGRTKGGVAILVKNSIPAKHFCVSTNHQAEIHGVHIMIDNQKFKIFNVYCPPERELSLDQMELSDNQCLITGDFNSHSEAWGYDTADRRGEEVEEWQVDNNLLLLNDPDDPPTFFSRRWLTNTMPDLAFATNDLARKATRTVLSQLGGSDHKPVKITLDINFKPQDTKTFPRWNYKRANWERFLTLVDQYTGKINHKQQNINGKVKALNQAILKAAKESIPRGARKNYRPYWTEEFQELEDSLEEARNKVEEKPTQENNIALKAVTAKHRKTFIQEARKKWREKTEQLNMDKDGGKLWRLAQALNDENTKGSPVTIEQNQELLTDKKAADLFMTQYSENSQLHVPQERKREVREDQRAYQEAQVEPTMITPFSRRELEDGLASLKLEKSPGPDKITNEMLLHLGPKSKKKILQVFNDSWKTGCVPQVWREAIMAPVYKKGKEKTKAESYRKPNKLHRETNGTSHKHQTYVASRRQRTHQPRAGCLQTSPLYRRSDHLHFTGSGGWLPGKKAYTCCMD